MSGATPAVHPFQSCASRGGSLRRCTSLSIARVIMVQVHPVPGVVHDSGAWHGEHFLGNRWRRTPFQEESCVGASGCATMLSRVLLSGWKGPCHLRPITSRASKPRTYTHLRALALLRCNSTVLRGLLRLCRRVRRRPVAGHSRSFCGAASCHLARPPHPPWADAHALLCVPPGLLITHQPRRLLHDAPAAAAFALFPTGTCQRCGRWSTPTAGRRIRPAPFRFRTVSRECRNLMVAALHADFKGHARRGNLIDMGRNLRTVHNTYLPSGALQMRVAGKEHCALGSGRA